MEKVEKEEEVNTVEEEVNQESTAMAVEEVNQENTVVEEINEDILQKQILR